MIDTFDFNPKLLHLFTALANQASLRFNIYFSTNLLEYFI